MTNTLSPTQLTIARILSKGENYPLGIVAASKGKLERNSVYVIISRMEEKGHVSSRYKRRVGDQRPRRMCRLTAAGKKAMEVSK